MDDFPSSQLRNSQISFVSAVFAVPLKIFSSLLTNVSSKKNELGRKDSNLRIQVPKTCALPLGHAPIPETVRRSIFPVSLLRFSGNTPSAAMALSASPGSAPPELSRPESLLRAVETVRRPSNHCPRARPDKLRD